MLRIELTTYEFCVAKVKILHTSSDDTWMALIRSPFYRVNTLYHFNSERLELICCFYYHAPSLSLPVHVHRSEKVAARDRRRTLHLHQINANIHLLFTHIFA